TRALDAALGTRKRAKQAVTDAGYEVQTVRIATQPVLEDAGGRERASALIALQALDRAVVAESVLLSVGPVLAPDGDDPDFAAWAAELAHTTKNVSFTVRVASPERGTSPRGVTAARAGEGREHRGDHRGAHRRAVWRAFDARRVRGHHGRAQEPAGQDVRVLGAHAPGPGRSGAGATRVGRAVQRARSAPVFQRLRHG